MATQYSYPGVYIEEFAPAAPIEGVGTSTAAFIGVAERGDLDTPTKLTSWDQFRATFGEQPVPGFYLWYAVRASSITAARSATSYGPATGLTGRPIARPRATSREPGDPGARAPARALAITVGVQEKNLLQSANTQVFQPTGTITGGAGTQFLTLNWAQGRQFRAGDFVAVGGHRPRRGAACDADGPGRGDPSAGRGAVGGDDAAAGGRACRHAPAAHPVERGHSRRRPRCRDRPHHPGPARVGQSSSRCRWSTWTPA